MYSVFVWWYLVKYEDEGDDILCLLPLIPGNRHNANFEMIIPRYNDSQFKSHFRIGHEFLEILCQKLSTSENLVNQSNSGKFVYFCTAQPNSSFGD